MDIKNKRFNRCNFIVTDDEWRKIKIARLEEDSPLTMVFWVRELALRGLEVTKDELKK